MQAIVNGVVVADSSATIMVEGNHYFPPDSIKSEHFTRTRSHTVCLWKGIASYYTVTVEGATYEDVAWFYPHPSPLARKIKNYVAFYPIVEVADDHQQTDQRR